MSSRIFCFILAGIVLPPFTILAQTMESVDSRHVFRDANLVVVLQVKKLEAYLDDEAQEGLARSHAWLKDITHLPTANCQEIIYQIGGEEYPNEPGHRSLNKTAGFAFRCNEASGEGSDEGESGDGNISSLVVDAFRGRFNFDDYDHRKQVYFMRDAREPTYYFGVESLLICETERTIAMIESELASEDREVPILETMTRDTDLAVQIDFKNESFRQFFPGIFHRLDEFQNSECLKTIAEHASSASLSIKLDSMRPFTLQLEVSESGDVEKLKRAVEEFADAGQQYAAMLQRELTRGAPSKKVTDHATAFADSLAAWLAEPEITSDMTSVTLQIDDIPNGEATLNNFVKMMNALAEHFGA